MIMRIVMLYVGTVIGAGFASGQEILQFFIDYGYKGILGNVLAGILFIYLGFVVIYISSKLNAKELQAGFA